MIPLNVIRDHIVVVIVFNKWLYLPNIEKRKV